MTATITAIARTFDVAIGASGDWPERNAVPVHGRMTVDQALRAALDGSGWSAREIGAKTWRIERTVAVTPVKVRSAAPEISGEPMTITGTKRRVALRDLPMSGDVVVLGERAQLQPPADTAALSARIPGLMLGGPGAGQARLFLQGVADSAFNGAAPSTVAVLLDNARLSYAGSAPDLRLIDMDRVEVLEGPQGTLYGAGTLGGIYRMVTNRPDPEHVTGDWTAWGGATARTARGGRADAPDGGASVVVNVPLVTGLVALRGVGYDDRTAGWITTAGQPATNSTATTGGRIALSAAVGGGWQIDLTGLRQSIRTANSSYVYSAQSLDRPAQAAEPSMSAIETLAVTATGPLGAAQATVSSSRTLRQARLVYDATLGGAELGLPDPALFFESTRELLWDHEARVVGRSGRLDWVAGLSWFQVDYSRNHALTGAAGESVSVDRLDLDSSEIAGFFDGSWNFARHWDLDAGARLFHDTLRQDLVTPDSATIASVTHHVGISPGAALNWKPDNRTTAYLRVASAFRQAQLSEADTDSEGRAGASRGDHLTTAELGIRRSLPSATAEGGLLSFSVHVTRWDDMVSDTLLANAIIATRDAGQARVVGGQGRIKFSPVHNWWVEAGGEADAAHLVRNALGFALDDTRLPVVPTYTASVAVHREFAAFGGIADLGGSLHQIGPGRLSFDPALDRRIQARLETGLSGQVRWRHVLAAMQISNLADARSDTFAYGNPLRLMSNPQYVPMRPRTLLFSVGFRP